MQKLKILTFVSKITGKEGTGLDSQIFEEFYRISKICDLHVITEDVLITESNILKIFQVPKISIPKIRGIFKILSYMSKSIINRKKYDVVYVRTSSPPEILSALWLKIFFKKRKKTKKRNT